MIVDLLEPHGAPPLPTAVAYPCDAESLGAAEEAAARGLIVPTLVGPPTEMRAVAERAGIDLRPFEIVAAEGEAGAAEAAVALVLTGKAAALMKGSLHSDAILHAALRAPALHTKRRVSHAYVVLLVGHEGPLILTDTVVNVAPTLDEKADITQNAIDLANALGLAGPRVAILSAVETVCAGIPSTLDAAALAKMAERGQIHGGVVDGPLAFDDAIDPHAAQMKGIVSPVAGRANVLVVPDLESGNILAKELEFVDHAAVAGIVLGLTVPIILTSRAETVETRVASCALAARYVAATTPVRA